MVLGEAPATRCAEGAAGRGGTVQRGGGQRGRRATGPRLCAESPGPLPRPEGCWPLPTPGKRASAFALFPKGKATVFPHETEPFLSNRRNSPAKSSLCSPTAGLRLAPSPRVCANVPATTPAPPSLVRPFGPARCQFFFCAFSPVSYSSGAVNLTWPGVTLPSPFYLFLNVTISLLASEDIKCPPPYVVLGKLFDLSFCFLL